MPAKIWWAEGAEYRAGPADGKGFQLPRTKAFPIDTALFEWVSKSKISMPGKGWERTRSSFRMSAKFRYCRKYGIAIIIKSFGSSLFLFFGLDLNGGQ